MSKSVFSDAYAILLEVLIKARKDAGVTQVELASRLGRPQPFISYVESGERRIDVIEFCAIAQALEIDAVALFTQIASRLPDQIDI